MSKERLIYDPTAGPGIDGVCGNCLNGGHHICDRENCKCKANGHKAWWWVPESNKIELWTPWKWEEMDHCPPGEEPQGTTIMQSGGHYVCHQLNIRPIEQRQQLAKAIVAAVNSTYGQNIAPEAVKDMYVALHDCDDSTSLSVCFRCLSDLLPKEETSWIEWLKKQGDIIDAAIEKATIK